MDGGRHRERYVRAHGDFVRTVGFIRYISGLSPRIPEQNAGKHRPECTDDTIVFGMTWDDVYTVTKARRVLPNKRRLRLA